MKPLTNSLLIAFAVCSTQVPAAIADVTIKQNVTVSASGAMSMMGSSGTVTTVISGNRGRTENEMESTSALMKKFAKNANTATIVLLGNQTMLNLAPEKQQYSEITFEQLRAQMEQSQAQLEEIGDEGGLPVSEDECQWSAPKMEVIKTKEKQKFAGIKAEQTLISVTQTCTIPDSEKSCNMIWNLEYWNADRMPGEAEAAAFHKGLARAMGGDEALGMAQVYTRGLMAIFKQGWDDVLKESGKTEGYPVKTVMSLEMGGESCTTDAGQQIASDNVWGDAIDSSMGAAAGSAASLGGEVIGYKAAQQVGGETGFIAGEAIGAASTELMKGAFKGFGKKKKKTEPVAQADSPADSPASNSVTLFTITTELTGVDEKKVSDKLFAVPAGWEKVPSASW